MKLCLTVSPEKRKPQNDGYIALITAGHPQFGDEEVTILSVSVVKNMEEAKQWFDKMKVEQPWIERS